MCLNLMFTGIFTIISRLLYCTYWWCKHCYLKCYQPVYIRGLYNVRYTTVRCTPDLFGASFISVRLKCIMFTFILYTVITRKLWNRKTTLFQYLSVFDVVTKQKVLLDTIKSLIKWNLSVFTVHLLCPKLIVLQGVPRNMTVDE